MEKRMSKLEFEILTFLAAEKNASLSLVSGRIAESQEMMRAALEKLCEEKLVERRDSGYALGKMGKEVLEPFRVKRAIIFAAGFGSRMLPLTLKTPKPLVEVRGRSFIETILDALYKAEIREIYIVCGYLKEKFLPLQKKYPTVRLLYNKHYDKANNILSAFIARKYLSDCYVFDGDLFIENPNIVRRYEYESNYLTSYEKETEDWCFVLDENKKITSVDIGGKDTHRMYGISFWNREDGNRLMERIERAIRLPNGKDRFWDEVALTIYKEDFSIAVRECNADDIIEIDSYEELIAFDPAYKSTTVFCKGIL